MSLTTEEIAQINRVKQQYFNRQDTSNVTNMVDNISLAGISEETLKALVIPEFSRGIDWNTLPYATLDTNYMNTIAPGSIDVRTLKMKLSNRSLLKAQVTDVLDTQSGLMKITSSIIVNADIDDYVIARTISQGTALQLVNSSATVNSEKVANKPIKSVFVGV